MPPRLAPPASPLPATARWHRLIEWLRSGEPLTTTVAADELGVSRRTVMRDLHHLREVLGLKVRYESTQGTYTLPPDHSALPFVPHPGLLKTILNGSPAGDSEAPNAVRIRFSARSVQSYVAASGLDLSEHLDAEGRLEMTYAPEIEQDFLRWVLSCGSAAEVLSPFDFRCRVQMEIRRMMEVYEPPS